MTPLSFESHYAPLWRELDQALQRIETGSVRRNAAGSRATPPLDAVRVAALYRRSCEHLALARARAYPIHLVERLETLTQRAHQVIYAHPRSGAAAMARLLRHGFAQAVRAHSRYVWVAWLAFGVPLLATGLLTYLDPGFILSIISAEQAREFDSMYGAGQATTRLRSAGEDWRMFGHYVMNNISVSFQCFAGGIFFGVGSLFFLVVNGVLIGAAAGYLSARGRADVFFAFVATHSAFELTAIVISGAAGLRIGHALLAPGRLTRQRAVTQAATQAVPLIVGAVAMLLLAAGVEAFWSSAAWVSPTVKYAVALACWSAVLVYLSGIGAAWTVPQRANTAASDAEP